MNEYLNDIEKLDNKPSNWDEVKLRVEKLCEGINRAVESEFRGMYSSAYRTIKNQMDGYEDKSETISALSTSTHIHNVQPDTEFFRMRLVSNEERNPLKPKDMFHIPFDKRGKMKTQRYSVPGHPCLYIGYSIYGSWEEMSRPTFENCMVSILVNTAEIKTLDLRIPTVDKWNRDMTECLLLYPLILSCMIQVKDSKDDFKPEYIIPQLIMEWLIVHNFHERPERRIHGILYTSAHKNEDFGYPIEKLENIAMPTIDTLATKGFCKKLSSIFRISKQTYNEFERLKHGTQLAWEPDPMATDPNPIRINNYRVSDFCIPESYVHDYPTECVI